MGYGQPVPVPVDLHNPLDCMMESVQHHLDAEVIEC
jgi:hypothetical protein